MLQLSLATGLSAVPETASTETLPNIILCMADDQGWGDVGYYGKSIARTPVLDEMAAQGIRFDRFYAAAPVCSPTRGSVLTGRHPNRYACFSWGHSILPGEITIAEALKRAGYTTGHFGKWHVGSVDPRSDVSPGMSGFDEWFSSPNFFDNDPLMCHNGKVVRTKGESSIVTMNAAIEFIRNCQDKNRRFLAVVWFGSPHNPHAAVEQDRRVFADEPEAQQHYYGEISGIDRSMGRLRTELRRLNIADNTLLWYTSDNGPQGPLSRNLPGSSGGLRDRKNTVWEGGLRVPAILEWPKRFPHHRVITTPCGTVDIYPTLLKIAGVEIREQPSLDGMDILPIIDGTSLVRTSGLGFWHYPTRGTGMKSAAMLELLEASLASGQQPDFTPNDARDRKQRIDTAQAQFMKSGAKGHAAWIDGDFKLHRIQDTLGDVKYELYNLKRDVTESNDLSRVMPDRLRLMKTELETWQKSVIDDLADSRDAE